jgi:hypothetical protein
MPSKVLVLVACAMIALAGARGAAADRHSRLWNLYTGQGRCLDVVNDPARDKLAMAKCGNFTGQQWSFVPAADGTILFRLRNVFSGEELCLGVFDDVIDGGADDRLAMAKCGDVSGQLWTIALSPNDAGYYAVTNQLTGPGKCLDIVNDANDNQLIMADCGDFSGQMWRMDPAD